MIISVHLTLTLGTCGFARTFALEVSALLGFSIFLSLLQSYASADNNNAHEPEIHASRRIAFGQPKRVPICEITGAPRKAAKMCEVCDHAYTADARSAPKV
jgi:hypothetical protein